MNAFITRRLYSIISKKSANLTLKLFLHLHIYVLIIWRKIYNNWNFRWKKRLRAAEWCSLTLLILVKISQWPLLEIRIPLNKRLVDLLQLLKMLISNSIFGTFNTPMTSNMPDMWWSSYKIYFSPIKFVFWKTGIRSRVNSNKINTFMIAFLND